MAEEIKRKQVSLYPEDVEYILTVGNNELHSKNFSATLRFIIRDRKERKERENKSQGENES